MTRRHMMRVWVRRLWPAVLAAVIVAGGGWLPSLTLGHGPTTRFTAESASMLVCPSVPSQSAGSVLVSDHGQPVNGSYAPMTSKAGRPARASRMKTSPVVTLPAANPAALLTLKSATAGAFTFARGQGALFSGAFGAPCGQPDTSWWFIGAGSAVGRADSIIVTNPAAQAATVNIEALTASGLQHSATSLGITVGARARAALPMTSLFPGVANAALHISTTSGQVHAAVLRSEYLGSTGHGAQWLPPTQPGWQLVPVPTDASDAVLVIAAEKSATVSVQAGGTGGDFSPEGMSAVTVPAGSVVTLPAATVAPDGQVLVITSSAPVLAGLIAHVSGGRGVRPDVIATAGVATSPTVAGGVALPGYGTRVTVVADRGKTSRVRVRLGVGSKSWRRTVTVGAGSAVVLSLPPVTTPTAIDVTVESGSAAALVSMRAKTATTVLASDVNLPPVLTAELAPTVVQVAR